MTKNKNDENAPHLEITEVIVVHYDVVNNICQQNSTVWCTFAPNKSLLQLFEISTKILIFLKTFKFGLMILSLIYWSEL